MKLLVVEDNELLLESIVQLLSDEYTIDTAMDGEEGLYLAEQNIYDAIVLDVMLPEMDGFEIVERMRKQDIDTPVLFLTAKDALEDRVKGLNLGADDYIVKPFQNMELKARISAILRRSSKVMLDKTLTYKGIVIDVQKKRVTVNDDDLSFTIKQYELLEYLIQNVEQILTREQIYDRVWGFDSETTIGIVEVYIHQIRKKLQPYGYDKDVQTMRGLGYMLASQ
ncbi:DNA-binding response OmpR family regulator [Pullulanibacillus pueri]|uniref:DNA-binding response regulator n=1 Tax=Pullulanibacillus pueri TaxID=1437324 RepID=A0A8J3A0Y2_9BACL|nr:response regulator transcription factor [Pullulanibacillus pueri]MBM7684211.1 DNA-binding response OmpR family regulator [Pullulanibacillus pueri]GGH88974.1 DNA-binding response regulator [Pullulanibacillus pueri]